MTEQTYTRVERVTLIEKIISQASGVGIAEMRSHLRTRAYVEARQVVWYILHDHIGLSYLEIADIYERNHTTIMHGAKRMKRDKEAPIKRVMEQIKAKYPELMQGKRKSSTRTVDKWQF